MIGRAMQLQYLGRVADRKAPRLVEAWIADRDPGQPRPNAIEVNVLMTKNQLSQLASTLDAVLKKGEESRGQSSAFFKRLRMVPALVSRQPEKVDPDNVQRLADVVGLNEMLGGLPFSSLLMSTTEERWMAMSGSEQREFLDRLETLLELYRSYNSDRSLWFDLEGTPSNSGDDVMQVRLDDLP